MDIKQKSQPFAFLAHSKYTHSSKLPGNLTVWSGLVNGLCSASMYRGRNAVQWDSADATITPAWNADLWILVPPSWLWDVMVFRRIPNVQRHKL